MPGGGGLFSKTSVLFIIKKMSVKFCMVLAVSVKLVVSALAGTKIPGCTIAINGGLPHPQPLILKKRGSNNGFGFHLPNADGIVNVAANTSVRLACTGPSNHFTLFGNRTQEVQAICINGTTFSVGATKHQFGTLHCNQNAVHTAVRAGYSCYNGSSLVDIGFRVEKKFIKIIQICFSNTNLEAVWSKYDLVAGIAGRQVGASRPSFQDGGFYPGLNPATQYSRSTQIATFERLLQSKCLAKKLISETTDYFLAKGHLTARTDFVYESQQRGTFYYINVAPQWQTFNGGNWYILENNLRNFVDKRGLDLEVYTGTHGVVTYANKAGVQTQMYLFQDVNNNNQIPVPAVFWKVAYDPLTRLAAAMVGINNPHLSKAEVIASPLYWLCDDVSEQIQWVKWPRNSQKAGIGYCCDVNQLRTKVPSIPSFPVTGLLV